jgi:hypothetical protein
MSKLFTIAVVFAIAATTIAAAHAQDPTTGQRIVAQERAKGLLGSTPQTTGQSILAQERGRRSDRRLFEPSGAAPILVAGPTDHFDVRDAAVGAAAAMALALLAAGAVAFAGSRRPRAAARAAAELE